MRKEARMYKRLKKCQGHTIPRCYGLFEGEIGERRASCLVLQYCGVPYDGDMMEASWTFKFGIVDCLLDIHTNGVQHNDIAECNIVVRENGLPCIIDFDCAIELRCDLSMNIIFHDVKPRLSEFGCKELHDVGCTLSVWKPNTVHYMTFNIDAKWADTPELLATQAPEGAPLEEALRHARWTIERRRKFLAWRDSLPYD
ncbi:hypothetical protein B0H21DRAFT_752204 [Amylocystis lapponica]|nr:hypothetical protein B0H21DRAFT_752204 [Amylocystis lapponica]